MTGIESEVAHEDAKTLSAQSAVLPFRFLGEGGAYFRIWIVNLALTLLTLGIYSAWAKVRREQYFHRALSLDGSGFDYHGRPLSILKGRVLVFAMLLVLSLAENLDPLVYAVTLLLWFALAPWLLVKALRFRAYNTSYRGLRFGFDGGYRDATRIVIGFGLLTLISVGLLAPLFLHRLKTYTLSHLRYGHARFESSMSVAPFFMAVMVFGGVYVALGVAALIMLPLLGTLAGGTGVVLAIVLLMAGLLIGITFGRAYYTVTLANTVWNNTRLGVVGFRCALMPGAYTRILLSNAVLSLLTLGLYWPWAVVRAARYRAEQTACLDAHGLDEIIAGAGQEGIALGDEMAEALDFDIGI